MDKNRKDILSLLSTGPIQRYIREHEYATVKEVVLKHKALFGIPAARLFEQIESRKKAKDKIPTFYNTEGIIFPPRINFEQSSSETTARFKTEIVGSLMPAGNATAVDLTGGFGVDAYFLSQAVKTLEYVEPDTALADVAQHNHKLLGAGNIHWHVSSAEEFLNKCDQSFDLIYLDPSRRAKGRKVHAFEECEPDVARIKKQILDKVRFMLVKASPLLDIKAGIAQLGAARAVYVVSVRNECREVLFLCEQGYQGDPSVHAVNLEESHEPFVFTFDEEGGQSIEYSDPLRYLYEPNASILKAGAFKTIAQRFELKKLAPNTHYYTSDKFMPEFPGRRFRIEALVKPDPAVVPKYFPEGKANVSTRNYPLGPEQLKKKAGLTDGGEKFLLGFSGVKRKFLVVAERQ